MNSASSCLLCKWVRSWFNAEFAAGGDNCLDEKSEDWERNHSNEDVMWAREPNLDRLAQAGEIEISDPKAAFQIYLEIAENGSVNGMINVAWQYGFGKGIVVEPDFSAAQD